MPTFRLIVFYLCTLRGSNFQSGAQYIWFQFLSFQEKWKNTYLVLELGNATPGCWFWCESFWECLKFYGVQESCYDPINLENFSYCGDKYTLFLWILNQSLTRVLLSLTRPQCWLLIIMEKTIKTGFLDILWRIVSQMVGLRISSSTIFNTISQRWVHAAQMGQI